MRGKGYGLPYSDLRWSARQQGKVGHGGEDRRVGAQVSAQSAQAIRTSAPRVQIRTPLRVWRAEFAFYA
ncbi:hypothetical protein ABZZ36_43095 [Actinacidiphila glaucinigra]|uniref:hypothetical protein n=1 Tax=Actinacidiphila glaucinigra TaxID=235986 RepID=UPI0033AA31AA